ncbi:Methyltransferase-like protein 25 [Dissophora ornata]|nr:Methyltransferase-like protein 25 [Dissophora ornata]
MNCGGVENVGTACQPALSNGDASDHQYYHRDKEIKSFLPPGFNSLEEYLACLQSFLTRCEPITNLMIVDYFTTNSWETRMPKDWRDAFESEQGRLSSLDLMELVSLGKLRDFHVAPSSPSPPSPTTSEAASSSRSSCSHGSHERQSPSDWPESLKEFVGMIKKLSINRTLDSDFTRFKDTLDIHLIPGMSPKKLHEVEILSGLIASHAKDHAIGSVIDLGAGQGYLSRVLAFQHHLCVLGVDSDTIQTCGAQTTQKRTEKLFVNKTKLKGSGAGGKKAAAVSSSPTSKQNRPTRSSTPSSSVSEAMDDRHSTSSASVSVSATATPVIPATIKPCEKIKAGSRSRSISPSGSIGRSSNSGSSKKTSRAKRTRAKKEDAQNIPNSGTTGSTCILDTATLNIACSTTSTSALTQASMSTSTSTSVSTATSASNTVVPETDMQQQGKRSAVNDSANDPSLATTPGSNFQLQHITHHITAATLPTLLKEHFPKKSRLSTCCAGSDAGKEEQDSEERWTLCGLHACGDLTSNMIKLYLESSATCLFSVGCCYHWITERFDKDGNIAISDGTHGFPLSAAFNRHKAHLGEHAKMIACQSPERWLKYQKETQDAIHGHYFRALLHKMMVEKGLYPGPPAVAPVLGRMGKHRLKGFPHYLTTAIHRLRLPTDVIPPEEAQAAYEEFLEQDLYRIGILWALRTMLGPLFEGMILLDRATYLHENIVGDGKDDQKKGSVQLVAGFDVVESPRNMILVALKD